MIGRSVSLSGGRAAVGGEFRDVGPLFSAGAVFMFDVADNCPATGPDIDADGDVREAIVTNAAPQREAAEKAVISAVKRAQWRPAFRDGEPVATPELPFREPVYVRRPKEK